MKHMVPLFRQVVRRLPKNTRLVLPALPRWEEHLKAAFPEAVIVTSEQDKWDAFAAATAALAASGTVTLELAIAGLPAVVTNRMGTISTALFRLILKNRYFSLPNLVLDAEAMPEMFFGKCNADAIVPALVTLLESEGARSAQKFALEEAVERITPPGGLSPSDMAARAIMEHVK